MITNQIIKKKKKKKKEMGKKMENKNKKSCSKFMFHIIIPKSNITILL